MGQPRSKDHGSIDTGIEAVGTALRERREELALSRSDLAQRLHMGEEQLQALEEGESVSYTHLTLPTRLSV